MIDLDAMDAKHAQALLLDLDVADVGEYRKYFFGLHGQWPSVSAELRRLRQHSDDEDDAVAEFNAGFEAAKSGLTIDDEPTNTSHDQWQIGFAWFEIVRLRKVEEAAREVITRYGLASRQMRDLDAALEGK